MIYTVTGDPKEINFAPNLIEEIIQNVYTVLTTIQQSVPLDREFGIDGTHLDGPTLISQAKMTADIIEKVQTFEERVTVEEVKYEVDHNNGKLIPAVMIRINEGVL